MGMVASDCRVGNGFTEERKFELVGWDFCRGNTMGQRSPGGRGAQYLWHFKDIVFGVHDWSAGCKMPKAGGEAGKIGGRQTFETISN